MTQFFLLFLSLFSPEQFELGRRPGFSLFVYCLFFAFGLLPVVTRGGSRSIGSMKPFSN
jgi:hypothetical protein